jgi:hypothetical protein
MAKLVGAVDGFGTFALLEERRVTIPGLGRGNGSGFYLHMK